MSEIIREYGGFLLAAAGTFAILAILGETIFSPDGMLAELIRHWESGGW